MIELLFSGATVHTEAGVVEDGQVAVHAGQFVEVSETASQVVQRHLILPAGSQMLPGWIDLHIHGSHGVDVMDATPETLETLCQQLPKQGTTAFLATTMTASSSAIEAALANVAAFVADDPPAGATMLGIHLEGPFISREKLGAHRHEYVLPLDIALVEQWQSIAGGNIKMITLAPELSGATEFIQALCAMGIVPAIGHTNASMSEATRAIEAGCSHATHLYNAMSGVHHRTPGVAAAVLASSKVMAELIVDGHHVCPDMVHYTHQLKGPNQLCLVTDAMRAQCMGDGCFDLGGQTVSVANDRALLDEHTLAGSVLTMQQAVANYRQYTQCDLSTVVQLTAVNPAKQMGCFDHKGSICSGKDADMIVLDDSGDLILTLCRGQVVYNPLGL